MVSLLLCIILSNSFEPLSYSDSHHKLSKFRFEHTFKMVILPISNFSFRWTCLCEFGIIHIHGLPFIRNMLEGLSGFGHDVVVEAAVKGIFV